MIEPCWEHALVESSASISNKTFRLIALLQALPREPRQTTAPELHRRLEAEGHPLDRRSVERYLKALLKSKEFGPLIRCDDRSRPYGWSFRKDAQISLPGMDATMAVTWDLVARYLETLLPQAAHDKLAPVFREAKQWLQRGKAPGHAPWSKKVAYVPRGVHLLPAPVKPAVLDQVYTGLYNGQVMEILYKDREEPIRIHPLALVDRGPLRYLLALCWDYTDVRHFALHRMTRVRLLDERAKLLPGFDLQEYIQSGHLDIPSGKVIQLVLRFYDGAGEHLFETPLTKEQKIERHADGTVTLRAKIEETEELRWWIQGFGSHAEILKPVALRRAVALELQQAVARYC